MSKYPSQVDVKPSPSQDVYKNNYSLFLQDLNLIAIECCSSF